jgi:hypothetical protein
MLPGIFPPNSVLSFEASQSKKTADERQMNGKSTARYYRIYP